jgi:hypothetical protein
VTYAYGFLGVIYKIADAGAALIVTAAGSMP